MKFTAVCAAILFTMATQAAMAQGMQAKSPTQYPVHITSSAFHEVTAPGTTADGDGISIAMCPSPNEQTIIAGGYTGGGGAGGPVSSRPYVGANGRPVGWVVTDNTKEPYSAKVVCTAS